MNTVRKHLSAIKGGRLAAASFPARLAAFAISDVPGDDAAVIASGPTVADPTTFEDALKVLAKYDIEPPPRVRQRLEAGMRGKVEETPKPGDKRLARASTTIIATPARSLDAAAAIARRHGYQVRNLGDRIEGEAREVAEEHAQLALDAERTGKRIAILSGGETTVTVRGQGRGGRNCEYLLALAVALNGSPNIVAVAGDTDGIDGSEDNAGAFMLADTMSRAHAAGLDPQALLDGNDSYRLFGALDDLIVTGPTRTNVNDFRAILIG
jgi:hydroxypyruvate reductase